VSPPDGAAGVKRIKKVVLVLSGKGGVGKSTVACQVTVCRYASWLVSMRAGRMSRCACDTEAGRKACFKTV
jgi:hypothetical protein